MAYQPPAPPFPPSGVTGNWDPLYQALSTVGVLTQPPSAADWYLDIGATTHMASSLSKFPLQHLQPSSSVITVGDGAQLPANIRPSPPFPPLPPLYICAMFLLLPL